MKLSIVIPCRNEKAFIKECLDAIYLCDLPLNSEMSVFIIDGMSDDGTREIIQQEIQTRPNLHLVDNVHQLTPFAFNLGILAGGKVDFVQIVGARHILSKNYLLRCIEKLQDNTDCWCVGGKIINVFINKTGKIISKAMSTSFGMGFGNFRTLEKSGYTDTVTSPMYPAWVFEKIGLFDEELIRNQDDDFNFRVTKAGGKIWYEHEISLKYYVRGNYPNLWKQFLQYGYWKVYVNKKHKAVTTLRQLVPPLFVFYLIVCFLPFLISPLAGLIGVSGLMFYTLLNFLFSVFKGSTIKEMLELMLIFPILHISYGWGYLKGIFNFLILNKKPENSFSEMSR